MYGVEIDTVDTMKTAADLARARLIEELDGDLAVTHA